MLNVEIFQRKINSMDVTTNMIKNFAGLPLEEDPVLNRDI